MTNKIETGTVTVATPGAHYDLKATPRAMMSLFGAQFGGVTGLFERLRCMDVEAMAAVVVHGANLNRENARAVPENLFRAGLQDVLIPIIEYVAMLNNGGRPVDDTGDEKEPSGNGG